MTFDAKTFNDFRAVFMTEEIQRQTVLEILAENCHKKYDIVLDVGCGGGQVTTLLASMITAGHIYGVDISADVIEYAKQNHMKDGLSFIAQDFGVEFACLAPELKSLEGRVSLIFSNSVFQYIANVKNLSDSMYRLLAKGGKVCARILHIADPYMDLTPDEKAVHEREIMKMPDPQLRADEMFAAFKSAGFKVTANKSRDFKIVMTLDDFKQIFLPLSLSIYKPYLVASDEATVERVMEELAMKISASERYYTDASTGTLMVEHQTPSTFLTLEK